MEKLKIIIMLVAISLINSCIMEPEPEDTIVEYTINNSSSHNIELTFFNVYVADYLYKDTTFFLTQNSNIEYHPPFGGTNDSSYIIFDSIRQIIYRRNDGQARNILDKNNYTGGKVNDYLYQYEYEITDDDYENAIPIE
jgi:hypothetical protein